MNFLDIFYKNTHISNFKKICPMGVKLFHADGRTDMTKLIVAFRNFADAPKNTRPLKYTSPSKQSPAATTDLYSDGPRFKS